MNTQEQQIIEKHIEHSKKGFSSLQEFVIDQKACAYCGCCVSICPKASIQMGDESPQLVGDCNNCGICYLACPRTFLPMTSMQKWMFNTEEIPPLGSFERVELAGSTSSEILDKAPDGGVITTIFSYLLDNELFDAVITTGKQHDISWCYHPKPLVLTDGDGLLECADKKYDPNPLLSVLRDTTQYSKVAFAGLACHVQPVRKLQYAAQTYREILPAFAKAADKLTRNIDFVIGIGDIGRFGRGKIDVLLQEFGVSGEKEVARHLEERITANFVFQLHDGKTVPIPQSAVVKYPQPFCFLCNDFNGYVSDMSVDRSEYQQFNTILMRNKKAEDIFSQCLDRKLLQTRELPDEGRDFLKEMEPMLQAFTDYDLYGYEHYLKNGEFSIDPSMEQMFGNQESRRLRGLPENMMMELLKKYPQYGFCTKKRKAMGYVNPDIF